LISAGKNLSGSDLFKRFRAYIWTVTAKKKGDTGGVLGAAVAVAPNLLATNCHVVNGQDEIMISQDQTSYDAITATGDAKRDICLLEVKTRLPFAANSVPVSRLDVGTTAYALGNPQGVGLTFSNGIVSGVRRVQDQEFIQTTAPISKGSSCGALIDDRRNLLGITTFYLLGGQAMNFAIPIADFCKK